MLYLPIQIFPMCSSRFVTTGKAFPQKCELLPYPCGLMSSWAFVLWAFVQIHNERHTDIRKYRDYIKAHIPTGKLSEPFLKQGSSYRVVASKAVNLHFGARGAKRCVGIKVSRECFEVDI